MILQRLVCFLSVTDILGSCREYCAAAGHILHIIQVTLFAAISSHSLIFKQFSSMPRTALSWSKAQTYWA
jgi:hypothetical protein